MCCNTHPRIHVIRATLATLGRVVMRPSERISLSSGFSVTNSASIAIMSPRETEE